MCEPSSRRSPGAVFRKDRLARVALAQTECMAASRNSPWAPSYQNRALLPSERAFAQKDTACTQHVLRAEGLVRRRKILCIHSMFSVRRARSPTKGSCVYTIPFLKFTPVRGTVGCRRDPFVEERIRHVDNIFFCEKGSARSVRPSVSFFGVGGRSTRCATRRCG